MWRPWKALRRLLSPAEKNTTMMEMICMTMMMGTDIAMALVMMLKGLEQPIWGCMERMILYARNMLTVKITTALDIHCQYMW